MNSECTIHGPFKVSRWLANQDHITNKCPVCGGLIIAQVPARYAHATIADFEQEVQDKAVKYLRDHPKGNLLLLGPTGTGKTHLAAAIAAEAIKMGVQPYYTQALAASNRIIAEKTSQQFIDKPFLIVDEIGRQYNTSAESLRLFDLVNGRYNAMRPTVFIGNLKQDQFKEAVGEAIADRIREDHVKIFLTGESRRKAAKAAA